VRRVALHRGIGAAASEKLPNEPKKPLIFKDSRFLTVQKTRSRAGK